MRSEHLWSAAPASAAMSLMRSLSDIGHALAQIPVTEGGDVNAGLSFAILRNLQNASAEAASRLSLERLAELRRGAETLGLDRVLTAIDKAAAQVGNSTRRALLSRGVGEAVCFRRRRNLPRYR
jgi:hypothetical protein